MIDHITDEPCRTTTEFTGTILAATGASITTCGVIANNILLDHIIAMQVWVLSNLLLMIWAYGFARKWWDGGLSGAMLCLMYAFMLVSGLWGLVQ